jgi:hypothetical protein
MTAGYGRALIVDLDDPERLTELARLLRPYLEPTSPDELNLAPAAKYAQLSTKSLRRGIHCGALPARKVAGRWHLTREDVDAWVAASAPTKKTGIPSASTRKRTTSSSTAAAAIRGTE